MSLFKRTALVFLVGASLVLSACGGKGDAETVVNGLFASIKDHTYETASSYYAPSFFEKTPKNEWVAALRSINAKLGDLQSWKLAVWTVGERVGTSGSGTYYELTYDTAYSKYPARESLSLFKAAGDKGPPKIVGHHIESVGFLR